jgi:hypothetical protein
MKYQIVRKARSTYNMDGSPVWDMTHLETNLFSDVLRWIDRHANNTASIGAYVWGLLEKPVSYNDLDVAVHLCREWETRPTKANVIAALNRYLGVEPAPTAASPMLSQVPANRKDVKPC